MKQLAIAFVADGHTFVVLTDGSVYRAVVIGGKLDWHLDAPVPGSKAAWRAEP